MQIGIDVKCMHTNFGRHGHSSFGDISLSDHYTVYWYNEG